LHVSYGHVPFGFIGCFKEQFDRGFDFRFSFDFGVVDKGTAGLGTGGERTGGGVAEACAVTGHGEVEVGREGSDDGRGGSEGGKNNKKQGVSRNVWTVVAGFVTDSYIQSWTFYHNRWAQQ